MTEGAHIGRIDVSRFLLWAWSWHPTRRSSTAEVRPSTRCFDNLVA